MGTTMIELINCWQMVLLERTRLARTRGKFIEIEETEHFRRELGAEQMSHVLMVKSTLFFHIKLCEFRYIVSDFVVKLRHFEIVLGWSLRILDGTNLGKCSVNEEQG
jgi:hypothetical protein